MTELSPKHATANDLTQNELLFAIWSDLHFLRNVVVGWLVVTVLVPMVVAAGFMLQVIVTR